MLLPWMECHHVQLTSMPTVREGADPDVAANVVSLEFVPFGDKLL
jgi:hypothetical protein